MASQIVTATIANMLRDIETPGYWSPKKEKAQVV